jgi:LysM repeat protein
MNHNWFTASKKPLLLPMMLLSLVLPGCLGYDQAKVFKPIASPSVHGLNQDRVNRILKTAFSQIGNPYRYGGSSPETGFDCSGFVGWVYNQFGVSLPRSSRDMLAVGEPIGREELRPGDLVFFNYGYSHVGIYTGDDKYIHSPRTGKTVEEVNLDAKGRGDHFVAARRIIDNLGVTDISDRLKDEWIAQSRHQTDMALNEAVGQRHSASPRAVAAERPSQPRKTANRKAAPKKTSQTKQVTHKVASGDNLVTLAKRYGLSSNDIAAANNLRNKNKLKPGQTLVIPAKSKATPKSANQKTVSPKTKKNQATSGAKPKPGSKTQPKKKASSKT